MSEEDSIEQVYQDLCRSRSDIDYQYIREKLTEKEMEAKMRARDSIHKALASDIILARHWLSALANKENHRLSKKRKQREDESAQSPTGEPGKHWQEYLVEFLEESGTWDEPFKRKHGLELNGSIEQLLQRTARRLESDSYRLMRLLTCIAGRDQELKDTDVKWMVPYLESQLQLLRGDYKIKREEKKKYMENDFDYLAYQHLREKERLEKENQILTGKPLINFNTPDFQDGSHPPAKRQKTDERDARDSIDDNIDPIDPITNPAYEQIDVIATTTGSMKVEGNDGKCGCHKELCNLEKYDPRYSTQVRELATKVVRGRQDAEKRVHKAMAFAKSSLAKKLKVEESLGKTTASLRKELELRKVSQEQILALKKELRREDTLERKFVNSDPVLENKRSEDAFQLKRSQLVTQLKDFERLWYETRKEEKEHGMSLEESRIHEGHHDLMKKFKKDLNILENERERIWLEFVGGLDG
ncbi:hypothetical protein HYALB_00000708 [Hymenoscyphus albidus]|uniref:Uncharacterized protein n=1 Tax=Hymenoscyphus albidus TaxID=595503 RepID=A0A9N9LPE7_9HELO|nr:hypothetical protein HYALB_00000708 [Hymenoscyphus albidus]